jgi:hypothetical protein
LCNKRKVQHEKGDNSPNTVITSTCLEVPTGGSYCNFGEENGAEDKTGKLETAHRAKTKAITATMDSKSSNSKDKQ